VRRHWRDSHKERFLHWGGTSLLSLLLGLIFVLGGFPMNKQLWSPSYTFVTAGMCGCVLLVCCLLIDIWEINKPFAPLVWMGMNSLFVFVFSGSGLSMILGAIYWRRSDGSIQNFESWARVELFNSWVPGSTQWDRTAGARLLFTLCKIAFWLGVSGFLHYKRWYWKF